MSTQTTPGQSFPAPCKRCGGLLYQPADLCPYCGTRRPIATPSPLRFAGTHGLRPPPMQTDAGIESAAPELASPKAPIPPLKHLPLGAPVGSRWLLTRGLIALVVLILGYGVYTLFGDHRTAPPTYDEQDAKSTAGSIAPYTAEQTANSPVNAGTVNASVAPPRGLAAPVAAPHYRDLSESLRAAHAHEDAHDLSGAQAAVNAALSMDSGNADALQIQHEITPLEQRRDAALQTAHVCIKDRLWNCVEHSASDALALDSGSPEAKTLLQQAIVETGWVPLGGHAAPATKTVPSPSQVSHLPPSARTAQIVTAAPAAPAPNSIDAQERAIAQSGWRTTPASGAAPAH